MLLAEGEVALDAGLVRLPGGVADRQGEEHPRLCDQLGTVGSAGMIGERSMALRHA